MIIGVIESRFRDIKDYKFGMGMADTHISSTKRRDRLFLFGALAIVLLTLLGKEAVLFYFIIRLSLPCWLALSTATERKTKLLLGLDNGK